MNNVYLGAYRGRGTNLNSTLPASSLILTRSKNLNTSYRDLLVERRMVGSSNGELEAISGEERLAGRTS